MINRAFAFQPGLFRAAIALIGLILVAGGCGGIDPASSDSTPSTASAPPGSTATADDGNGNANGNGNGNGGIVWPSLPSGPDIPDTLEIHVYKVLEPADASRCAALFAGGVEVGNVVVSLVGATELNFVTGDRTRLLYTAGAHLCAGNETAAREAFAAAVTLGSWNEDAEDAETQTVVCTVWDTVAHLLDPNAGACTLQLADDGDPDDGDADATDDATPSDDPSATAGESDAADTTDAP